MASSKLLKKWIAANKKNLAVIQRKIKKFEGDLKKAEAAEKKAAPKKKAVAKKKTPARKKVAAKRKK